ncbi:low-density lipoprotein receptor-like protein [Dinothrombium tinctorium]|uniref:Low-density lipoprotein receptor-like protein n=1 Tax=Dinothrombium tinctorium TaxID=1965070 RepID=A0A3S4RJM0_9ACAR|nr:low-density lipoprotein receptor-like protein [Dinothrombium tinctorium]
MCDNNLCIDYSLRCDGLTDCTDGRDEHNCTCSDENEFKCENGDCQEREVRCDGVIDCLDGSDEWSCVRVDENGVVQLINPATNRWSPLCSTSNFTKKDADSICNRMGFESSLNYSSIIVEIGNTTDWAIYTHNIGVHLFSPNCSSIAAQTVACKTYECSVKVDTETKVGTSNEIQSIAKLKSKNSSKECLAQIISPLWLLASADCLRYS